MGDIKSFILMQYILMQCILVYFDLNAQLRLIAAYELGSCL